MNTPDTALISDIRSATRSLVRQFGLMNRTVAGSELSLSAAHALLEIGQGAPLLARDLGGMLLLEKSSVSRLVGSLVKAGLVQESRSTTDARAKELRLTGKGQQVLDGIHRHAAAQVETAIAPLPKEQHTTILTGLQTYASALQGAANDAAKPKNSPAVVLKTGYLPGLIGSTAQMLARHMHLSHGLGASFETKVATDMSDMVNRLETPGNQVWSAWHGERFAGSISIDGQSIGDGVAQLRWFGVMPQQRQRGTGRALLDAAVTFCDAIGFDAIDLWTVAGLDAARQLYESRGFSLAEELTATQWGPEMTEQRFRRLCAGA